MKITLHRYLMKEQLVPLSVCVLALSFVLVTGRMLQLTQYLFTSSVTLVDLAEIMAYAMPKLILYSLPLATLIGILLAFLRLNADSELIALRAAGIAFYQFLPPVLGVLVTVTAFSYFNAVFLVPLSNSAFEYKLRSLGKASLPALLKEGTFIDDIPKLVFFFQSVNASDLSIRGIFVQDQRQENVRVAIIAERARIVQQREANHLTMKLQDGFITRVGDDMKEAQCVSFKAYDLFISFDDLFDQPVKRVKQEMTLKELLVNMRTEQYEKFRRNFSMEFHQRLAFPLSCILLGLLGPPLGSLFRQGGRMAGITLGVAVFLAYYLAISAGKGLGKNGLLPPALAMWTPNVATLIAVCYFWIKAQRETPFQLAAAWKSVQPYFESVLGRFKPKRKERA
ncbi:MAG: LPS export ABC transporter permease LptF [Acidobacteriota bacterium]